MHSTIAVGVSDPTASRDALEWAMGRAVRRDSEVVLVHVLADTGDGADAGDGARMLQRELRHAESIAPTRSVRVRSLQGSVMWQLVAASDDFDLIVVGTHKTGFIHGSVFGSSALSLAATAACPVVVVPAPAVADPEEVVVGADDSVAGLAALEFAAAEAAMTEQALVIVRASSLESGVRGENRLLARLRAVASASQPGLHVQVRLLKGSPAEVLVAASRGSRLLVLGDSRTGSSAPPVLGAVCHDALVNIRVPTAIVHSSDSTGREADSRRAAWLRSARAASGGVRDTPAEPVADPGTSALSTSGAHVETAKRAHAMRQVRAVDPGARSNGAVAPHPSSSRVSSTSPARPTTAGQEHRTSLPWVPKPATEPEQQVATRIGVDADEYVRVRRRLLTGLPVLEAVGRIDAAGFAHLILWSGRDVPLTRTQDRVAILADTDGRVAQVGAF